MHTFFLYLFWNTRILIRFLFLSMNESSVLGREYGIQMRKQSLCGRFISNPQVVSTSSQTVWRDPWGSTSSFSFCLMDHLACIRHAYRTSGLHFNFIISTVRFLFAVPFALLSWRGGVFSIGKSNRMENICYTRI